MGCRIQAAANEFGVDPYLLKAMVQIESGGDANAYRASDSYDSAPAVGLMQVKPDYWQHLVPDADPYTPEGNLRLGAAIMGQSIDQYGSWESALTNVYFPGDDINGTSQGSYVGMVNDYMTTMRGNAPAESAYVEPTYSESVYQEPMYEESGHEGHQHGPPPGYVPPSTPIYSEPTYISPAPVREKYVDQYQSGWRDLYREYPRGHGTEYSSL